jgi:hypothetical protein
MLKDPLLSGKSNLARKLISEVKWEEKKSPHYCHKALCFAITNLYLDYFGRNQNMGILKGALDSAKKFAYRVDQQAEFTEWCW